MKKQVMLLIVFVVALSIITTISAVPPEPMAFYGKVTFTNGSAIPNGYYLVAKINNVISGECGIINGDYGKGTNTCIVVTHSTTTSKVEFFLGENKIGESTFQSKEIVNLNFNTDNLPTSSSPLSDGICKPAECFYNILDCDNSITKICVGNGVCDSGIGETCENTPSDCGVCPTTTSSSGSSGGGSSGGGGGGGSTTKKDTNLIVLSADDSDTNSSVSVNESATGNLNIESESSENTGLFRLTGLAIGDFVKSPTGKGLLMFVVLVAILIVLFIISKKINSKRNKDISKEKLLSNGKSKKRSSKQKNIKVVKLSEMRKRNSQN
jgi:hypothetical protein